MLYLIIYCSCCCLARGDDGGGDGFSDGFMYMQATSWEADTKVITIRKRMANNVYVKYPLLPTTTTFLQVLNSRGNQLSPIAG